LRADGVPQAFDLAGRRVQVAVQDELGRIDLNQADGTLLTSLFFSIGLDAAAAAALVDKILDWRDASPLKRLNGAKAADYRTAGYGYQPRNGPFQSVDELKLVMGMTPEIFARVEKAVTVYSGRPRFDPQVAPREALLALPAMDAAQAAAIMAARASQAGVAAGGLPGGFGDPLTALKGRAFTLVAQFQATDRVVTRKAAIRISGNPNQPYWVLNWQRR
jgi:general secretion pathway protein K